MSVISGVVGASATRSAAKKEAASADYATQVQYQMWQEAQQSFKPFLEAGKTGVADLKNLVGQGDQFTQQQQAANQAVQDFDLTQAPNAAYTVNPITGEIVTGQGASVSGQDLSAGGVLSPTGPELPGELDFQFDPNDPIFKYKQEQLNEQVNRQLASRGLYDSRAGLDVLADANMRLSASEIDKQYSRAVAERDYLTQTALDKYQLEAARGQTLYDRLYSQQTDLYNRLYGQAQTEDARRLGLINAQQSSAQNLYSQEYQGALDLTKIGAGAAGSAGQGSIQTGQDIANTISTSGVNQANAVLAQGQIGQNTISGAANAVYNYYNRQPAANAAAGAATSSYYSDFLSSNAADWANQIW